MRILLPVDGSVYSLVAIKYLATRRELLGDALEVELLNIQDNVPKNLANPVYLEAIAAYSRDEADKVFRELDPLLEELQLKAEKKIVCGNYGDMIVEEAEKWKADLIIMGTHGRSGFKSLFLGSVSIRVLSKTVCPVLLLRDETPVVTDGQRVGLCVDDPAHSLMAARFVAGHIKFYGHDPKFTVISVKTTQLDKSEAVEPVMKILAEAGVKAESVILKGAASEEISDYAEEALDMLVMGSHGYGNFKSAVLGSTTSRVAAKCKQPILIVKV